ncbi:hypothetical protein LTR84_011538 [Exophiala bonariae]|uniref:Uncharacterized protein n=1 Tax=Exophiala bonariae TaxID=1690606 RepID=A0AAV9NGG2_9EURO|nr:hypothetical protein LTR84_011538 [Exophiala bonariae]
MPAKCPYCYQWYAEEALLEGRTMIPYQDYLNRALENMYVPEHLSWLIPIMPRFDLHFREIDWNPPERKIPLESGEVSPKTKSSSIDIPAGVINAEFDPRDWILADKDRTLVMNAGQDLHDVPYPIEPRPRNPVGQASDFPKTPANVPDPADCKVNMVPPGMRGPQWKPWTPLSPPVGPPKEHTLIPRGLRPKFAASFEDWPEPLKPRRKGWSE